MRFTPIVALSIVSLTISACSLDDLLNGDKPAEGSVVDPNEVSTYEGAVGQYYATIQAMSTAIGIVSEDVGVVTDELSLYQGGNNVFFDTRNAGYGEEGIRSQSYNSLQTARVRAAQASEVLLRYGTAASYPLVGHAYALQAHAIVLMAELFCSGVPLTDVPFEGGITFTEGLSTTTLLNRAVALFDTAYQYGKDSLPIATFARVGKGRALLSLGKYAEAAQAVNGVPTDAKYSIAFSALVEGVQFWTEPNFGGSNGYIVMNREGSNGIDWIATTPRQQDPRLPVSTSADSSAFENPLRQLKYLNQSATVIVADGIQARMIEAEAQLQPPNAPQGVWLETLNMARHTRGLTSLTDPGTAEQRVDLVFRERAFWFYLNGQRLGDMRRLVRNYRRLPDQVYATGSYPLPGLLYPTYGKEYVFILPKIEQQYNPLYKGCIHKEP